MAAENKIYDMVSALTDPVITWPSAWANDLPQDLMNRVQAARLAQMMKGDPELASDVEALVYLYPRSMEAPMGYDWTEIYCYLTTQVFPDRVTDDIRQDELTSWQREDLDRLKRFIMETRLKVRKERERAARRAAREQEREVVKSIEQVKTPEQLRLF